MARTYTTSYSNELGSLAITVSKLPASSITLTGESADQVTESLVSAPLDRPETWTFGKKDVADVYKDTSIPTSARPVTSRGVQIIVRHDSFTAVTDSDNADFFKVLPMSSWTCLRVPINELMDADQCLAELKRMFAGVLGSADTSARLAEMIRGALRAD
jgi:hypothetical protein